MIRLRIGDDNHISWLGKEYEKLYEFISWKGNNERLCVTRDIYLSMSFEVKIRLNYKISGGKDDWYYIYIYLKNVYDEDF